MAGLRATFRVLDVVAPRVGAAKAMDLWCTLPGNAGRRKDFRPYDGERTTLPAPRGGHVAIESWGSGPVVYLVHGWGGWRGQLGAFVEPLVEAGFQVVGFDAPGHGDADESVMGEGRGTIMELMEAFEVVGAAFGPADGVIAHSLGCTASALVVEASVPARSLVLLAPNSDVIDITYEFAAALGFTERTRGHLQAIMEEFCERPLHAFDLRPLGADGSMPDALVVHDRSDKETPFEVGASLAGAWPNATFHPTDGLGHQRLLADPSTIARAVQHLAGARSTQA